MDIADVGGLGPETVLVLAAVSILVGVVLGFYFSWVAVLVSGIGLAIVSAAVLQKEGFGFLAGISIIVSCLSLNQIAYLFGVTMAQCGTKERIAALSHERHDDPRESTHEHIGREYKRQEQAPPEIVPRSARRLSGGSYGFVHVVIPCRSRPLCLVA
jgi:hypothetical protein